MKLYINQIDKNTIQIGNEYTFAMFKANVLKSGTVTIKDMSKKGISYICNLVNLYINGELAPQDPQEAIVALNFIGSYMSTGESSGPSSPVDESQIRRIVKSEIEDLNLPDGAIEPADINSLS